MNKLAGLYHEMGTYGDALPLYQRALEVYERLPGYEDHVTAIQKKLEDIYTKI